MAYDYNKYKSVYEGLNDDQRQKWDAKYGNTDQYKQFKADYAKETNNTPQQDTNTANFTNQGGANGQNATQNQTPTIQKTENQTYGKTEFDKNEQLDKSMFNKAPGQITVKEGTAKETGKPDYQLESDARLNEMKQNLDQYFATSPRMFNDRETFNKVFEYNSRESEAQRELLDSYWKRKQDIDKANLFTTGDAISNGMKDADITPDQLNYIKEYNEPAYREWMQKQMDDINLRIANLATPADPTDTAELFNSLVEKLNLDPGDPYQIYDNWYNMCERLGVFTDSDKLKSYQTQLDQNHSKMESIMTRYAASTGGTVSDALAAARMQKALAPYQQREVDLQNSYTTLLNGRNSNLAVANQSANALAMQAAEDQRIWNQRYQALGFAMSTASYRTPEQQAQLQLQSQQIQSDMSLLNQAKTNDLSLYNQYALAKLNNKLNSELTDLSVTDEAQLRANLNNVLSGYYDQWGAIIQRPQSEVVDDVLAYAKANNVTVAEALRKNFIEPLQSKKEYKTKVAEEYGLNKYQQQYSYTIDEDGNVKITATGYGQIPQDAFKTRKDRQNAYEDVYDYSGTWADYVQNLAGAIQDGSYGGQCGAFCNDVLLAGGDSKIFGDTLEQKIKACNVKKEDGPQVGYAAVFDFGYMSSDGKNHGHVGIITAVNGDGSIDVLESNGKSDEKIHVKRYPKSTVDRAVKGYYKPSNYDIKKEGIVDATYSSLKQKFGNNNTWNENGYIESLATDFEQYLQNGKDAITKDQWADLKNDYGINEEEFREMAHIYAKTGLKKKGVSQAENALKSAIKLKDMLSNSKTLFVKDNPQRGLIYRAINQWIPRTDAGEAKNQYNTLLSQLQLNALFTAKDNGATFGAMSQGEWDILGNASTNLKWNSSGNTFDTNLQDLINELVTVVSEGGGTLPSGVFNTDI